MKDSKSFNIIFILVIIALVFFFYVSIATACRGSFNFKLDYKGYYSLLSYSLTRGHTYLPIYPNPEFLSLDDPYDPVANFNYRVYGGVHDLSLYNDRFYMYFGITPAFVLYVPYMLLVGKGLPDNFAVFLFSFFGFLFSLLLLIYIKNKYFNNFSSTLFCISIILLAVGNMTPWLMERPQFYEVAISCGFCFLMGAIYFLSLSFSKKSLRWFLYFLGSLFLGLAVGARPHFIIPGGILVLFLLIKILIDSEINKSRKINLIVLLLAPFVFCILALAYYNYIRFDNPFEFGMTYQLSGHRFPKILSFDTFFANIYLYLFHDFEISTLFPFIYPTKPDFPDFLNVPDYYSSGHIDKLVGIAWLIPFLIMIFISPFILLIGLTFKYFFNPNKKLEIKTPGFEFWILFISAISVFSVLNLWGAVMVRFMADFAALFIILSLFLWFYSISLFQKESLSRLFLTQTGAILMIISITFCTAFAFQGEHGGIRTRNPNQFIKLSAVTRPISFIVYKLIM